MSTQIQNNKENNERTESSGGASSYSFFALQTNMLKQITQKKTNVPKSIYTSNKRIQKKGFQNLN